MLSTAAHLASRRGGARVQKTAVARWRWHLLNVGESRYAQQLVRSFGCEGIASCSSNAGVRSRQASFKAEAYRIGARSFSAATTETATERPHDGVQAVEPEYTRGALLVNKKARPLAITKDFVLYQSSVDIDEVLRVASLRCYIGAGFAATGFLTFLAGLAPVLAAPALVVLTCGFAANTYALTTIAQRVIRGVAVRHVERLVILPTADGFEEFKASEGGVTSLLSSAATVEERLLATKELCLELRTGGADRWLVLRDREEGEGVEDTRAAFGDICTTMRLIHVDYSSGACSDRAFLDALLTTPKVAADERVESIRENVAIGPMLSDVMESDVADAEKATTFEAPAKTIDALGKRVRIGGAAVLAAGVLFTLGESCRDDDGVPRWKNLPIKPSMLSL